jgi:hypothetical protein
LSLIKNTFSKQIKVIKFYITFLGLPGPFFFSDELAESFCVFATFFAFLPDPVVCDCVEISVCGSYTKNN